MNNLQSKNKRIIDLNRVIDFDVPTKLYKDENDMYFERWSLLIKTGEALQDLIELNFKLYSGDGFKLENQLGLADKGFLRLPEEYIISSVYHSSLELEQGNGLS